MKKIKMIHIQLLPILSGVQNMMLMLLSGLPAEKYDIVVVSRGGGDLGNRVIENGWKHIELNSLVRELSIKDIKAAWELFKIFKKEKPDIVHTHSSKPGFLGRIIAKLARVPLIIHTVHAFPFHKYQPAIINFFYVILESFASFFADYNIFVNRTERELAIHKLNFNKKKTLTIYNGISLYHKQKQYNHSMAEGQGVAFSYYDDINENNLLKIISVCRFSQPKNVVSTIEQAVKVVKQHDNVTFTFIGDGEFFEECKNIVINNNVANKIFLLGWQSDIQEKLLSYDLFLLNSLWEGLSIAILEAMSVGLPILCSNIKGNYELVDSSNGWLIEPYDLNAIDNVVSEILDDQSILIKKGAESIKKVTNHFSLELFICEYERIYSKIETSDRKN